VRSIETLMLGSSLAYARNARTFCVAPRARKPGVAKAHLFARRQTEPSFRRHLGENRWRDELPAAFRHRALERLLDGAQGMPAQSLAANTLAQIGNPRAVLALLAMCAILTALSDHFLTFDNLMNAMHNPLFYLAVYVPSVVGILLTGFYDGRGFDWLAGGTPDEWTNPAGGCDARRFAIIAIGLAVL
jgi:hypothetical protein